MSEQASPMWELPPDLRIGEDLPSFHNATATPVVWHLPLAKWEPIWKAFDGTGETIAILDTGISPHRNLPTPEAQRSFISGQSFLDGHGHGTHCAGTALGRDGIGVAPGARLLNAKVLSNQGSGSSTGIAAGVEWAIDNGATIISMSLGGGGRHIPTEKAIDRANSKGILVCCSAGNSGQRPGQNTMGHPALYVGSYASGSKQQNGSISGFSSAGPQMDGVTPGSNIVSASHNNQNGYRTMSGTSMSCPYAAGLFAVVRTGMAKAGLPRLKGIDDWRPWLSNFFIDKGAPGKDDVWGYGIPDYEKIVNYLYQLSIEWV